MALLYAKASNGYLASIPVNVMGFTQSFAPNGWQKLPSGLIIQWGRSATNANGNVGVAFPVAYTSTEGIRIWATPDELNGNDARSIFTLYCNGDPTSFCSFCTHVNGNQITNGYNYASIGY